MINQQIRMCFVCQRDPEGRHSGRLQQYIVLFYDQTGGLVTTGWAPVAAARIKGQLLEDGWLLVGT